MNVASELSELVPASGRETSTGAYVKVAVGISILVLILVAPLLAPYSPLTTSAAVLSGPSTHHWLGTDRLGRDVLSRFLAGGQLITILAICAGALAVGLGGFIGLVSGYLGGIVDVTLMRMVDVLLGLPPMLVILVMAAAVPRSNIIPVLLTGILLAPSTARILRGVAQQYAAREFVTAAEAAGLRWPSILLHEILPNVQGRFLLELALRTAYAVVLISSLNFLGVGVSPPTPDWGLEINSGRAVIMLAPWTVLAPAFGLAALVAAINLFADGIEGLL